MYIPTWLFIGAIILFFIYKSNNKSKNSSNSIENIEEGVRILKTSIFNPEHFDSPHFVDVQDSFDAMEVNYLRLKQRFIHTPEKVIELSRDWYRYVESLSNLKSARIILDVDFSDDAIDNLEESSKEPTVAKQEIEKKFKTLLGKDWLKIPPDYFERIRTMKKPDKKTSTRLSFDEWKYYYQNSSNFYKLESLRKKAEEEKKSKSDKTSS